MACTLCVYQYVAAMWICIERIMATAATVIVVKIRRWGCLRVCAKMRRFYFDYLLAFYWNVVKMLGDSIATES